MSRYVALIDGKAGAYGVVVPDLPGCTSGGRSIDAVLRNAVDAVRLWAEDARADGETLPRARSIETLRRDPEVAAALMKGAALAMSRSCSMQDGPPRPICPWMPGSWRRSTRPPRRTALRARLSSPAPRARRSHEAHRSLPVTSLGGRAVVPAPRYNCRKDC